MMAYRIDPSVDWTAHTRSPASLTRRKTSLRCLATTVDDCKESVLDGVEAAVNARNKFKLTSKLLIMSKTPEERVLEELVSVTMVGALGVP